MPDPPANESSRRTSTVSWSVPRENIAGPSTSQEQVKTVNFQKTNEQRCWILTSPLTRFHSFPTNIQKAVMVP